MTVTIYEIDRELDFVKRQRRMLNTLSEMIDRLNTQLIIKETELLRGSQPPPMGGDDWAELMHLASIVARGAEPPLGGLGREHRGAV